MSKSLKRLLEKERSADWRRIHQPGTPRLVLKGR